MNRRHFCRSAAGGLLALCPASRLLSQNTEPETILPPVRQLTHQPGCHWFGYYDKRQHFYSPASYTGEWRCDTHPRSSRSGKLVCIDSPHNSGRQLYLIDATRILAVA